MSEEPWFRMRPSKFMAGCRGLNANEVKVYISLICRIMEHGAPIEEDHEILATYCEVRPTSFAAALERLVRLKKLIRTSDDRLTNAFCDGEISWRASYSENQRRAGVKSAEKRKPNQAQAATIVHPAFSQKIREDRDKKEETIVSSTRKRATQKSRIPSDAVLSDEQRAVAVERGLSDAEAEAQFIKFRDWALAKGQSYADWKAAWRNWLTSPFYAPVTANANTGGPNGRPPSRSAEYLHDRLARLAERKH